MLYVVPMGELVVLILIDAGAVPGLYAEVRGRFRAQGPEGNGFTPWPVAGLRMDTAREFSLSKNTASFLNISRFSERVRPLSLVPGLEGEKCS